MREATDTGAVLDARGPRLRLSELLTGEEFARLTTALALTPREAEYLDLAVADPRDAVIAAKMEISVHTAHAHRMRLFAKMGVDGMARVFAVVLAACIAIGRSVNIHWREG